MQKPRSLKEALQNFLSEEEFKKLVTSFDIIGDIAVIEIPYELEKKEKAIGGAILQVHRNVKTVCKKLGRHEGKFRVMPVKIIAGKKRKLETIYKEHGIQMKVKIGEVYFSPRLSTERLRIAERVKEGESIAGFFAGIVPFPLVIAKKKKCKIYSIELNPKAYELMQENIKMNKLKGEIIPILGDVREIVHNLPACNRVLMPLPKGGENFLEYAFLVCKKNGIIHFYQFAPDEDLFSQALISIDKTARKMHRKVRILNKKIVRPHAPRQSQIVIDFSVS